MSGAMARSARPTPPRPLAAPTREPAEPAARFTDLLAAEWIKLRSLRSTYWVLALSVVVAVVINVNAVHSDFPYIDQPLRPGEHPYRYDPIDHVLNDIGAYLMMLAAASIGAISVFGEYATGMVRTTFAAVPARGAVVAAKVAVIGAVTLVLGVTVSTASFFLTNAMLSSRHVGLSIGDPGALRCVAAYALIVPVCGLIGIAFGAVLRHATASIVGIVALLFIVPLLFGGTRYEVLTRIGHCLPSSAEERLVVNPESMTTFGRYPAAIGTSWIVLAAWAAVSVAVAVTVVRKRDV